MSGSRGFVDFLSSIVRFMASFQPPSSNRFILLQLKQEEGHKQQSMSMKMNNTGILIKEKVSHRNIFPFPTIHLNVGPI